MHSVFALSAIGGAKSSLQMAIPPIILFSLQTQNGIQSHRYIIAIFTDSRRLTAINAIQLAVALVSNAFLLLNMARRVRFSIAQPITIVGW